MPPSFPRHSGKGHVWRLSRTGGRARGRTDASPRYRGSSPCRSYPESTSHRGHCCGQGSSWVPRRSDTPCECSAISRCCSTALRRSIQLHQAPNKRNRTSRCLSPQRLSALGTCPSQDYGCSSISRPPWLADPGQGLHRVPSPRCVPDRRISGRVAPSAALAPGQREGHRVHCKSHRAQSGTRTACNSYSIFLI